MSDYRDFLSTKHVKTHATGFDCSEDKLNRFLFDWQRVVVRYLLKLGRGAAFEDCGLGKTLQSLAWAEQIIRSGRALRGLLLAPPAVGQQTLREAEKFAISVDCRVVRDSSQVRSGINITNYERLHLFDTSVFDLVIFSEASILKSFMGKTKQGLLIAFRDCPWHLNETATPAPNDHLELGNQADSLGIMPANEMLSRWFINDTMSAGNYRLKKHAEDDYWRWVSSWAVSVSKPSDLGPYSDAGYELPPLNIVEHILGEQSILQLDRPKLSATTIHKEKRATAAERAAKVAEIVNSDRNTPWVIWCDTNYEADDLQASLPDAVEVRGSMRLEEKEEKLLAFSNGQIQRLITKAEIAGFGLNWQHCHKTAVYPSYSYERFYQLIRRFLRFGQTEQVDCHIVYTDEERPLVDTLDEKAKSHELMKSKMAENMKDFQQANLHGNLSLSAPAAPRAARGDGWTLWHGDCVEVARSIPDDSIDFCIHSPPFSNLYIYSDSIADMGNASSHSEFFEHYEYLIAELYRVTVPGRLCAVHCKDLPLYKGRDGAAGLYPFPDKITEAFNRHGWIKHSFVTIWKDPVTEMQRTKNHGLLHRQLCKDSSASRQGMADFLIVYRKWPDGVDEFPKPVTAGNTYCRFNRYVGESAPSTEGQLENIAETQLESPNAYSIQVWQRYASPVWFDIRQMRVLNYKLGKDAKDEKHICPLQLDVIERAVELWTNPGDLVYDPFNGIGSSGYVALKTGRKYVGSELKESYFRISIDNFEQARKELEAEKKNAQPLLPIFDIDDEDDKVDDRFHASIMAAIDAEETSLATSA